MIIFKRVRITWSIGGAMGYEFQHTERTLERGTEFETKTLLYLIGIDPDHKDIGIIFIDCFNDVTGADGKCVNLWDLQSKGVANLTPKKIGASLLTLFLNFKSNFIFRKYTLFIPKPRSTYLLDSNLSTFHLNNFGIQSEMIKNGLKAEISKHSTTAKPITTTEKMLDLFLNEVTFATDCIPISAYVKNLVYFKNKDLKSDDFYQTIFAEIRDNQAIKKIHNIHGKTISHPSDALAFNKHIYARDLRTLIINRLIGIDTFKRRSIPNYFIPEVEGLDTDTRKDLIEECNAQLSRAIFDKNSKKSFWAFFEACIIEAQKEPGKPSRDILGQVTSELSPVNKYFLGKPGLYLVALIQEGLEQ